MTMTEKQQEKAIRWVPIVITLIGSILGGYTGAKVQIGNLDTRVVAIERRVDKVEVGKLDVSSHQDLVARMDEMSSAMRQNNIDHQEIMKMLVQMSQERHYAVR